MKKLSNKNFQKICIDTQSEIMMAIAKLFESIPGHPFNDICLDCQGEYLAEKGFQIVDNLISEQVLDELLHIKYSNHVPDEETVLIEPEVVKSLVKQSLKNGIN